jgi:hypothetical protein
MQIVGQLAQGTQLPQAGTDGNVERKTLERAFASQPLPCVGVRFGNVEAPQDFQSLGGPGGDLRRICIPRAKGHGTSPDVSFSMSARSCARPARRFMRRRTSRETTISGPSGNDTSKAPSRYP